MLVVLAFVIFWCVFDVWVWLVGRARAVHDTSSETPKSSAHGHSSASLYPSSSRPAGV